MIKFEFVDEHGNRYVLADPDQAVLLNLRRVEAAVPEPAPEPEPEPEPAPEPTPEPPQPRNARLERLIDICWGNHDALPEGGQPNWDWFRNGRGGQNIQGGHINEWGQVCAVAGTPTYDVELELRNAQMWFLRRGGTWYRPKPVDNPEVEGAYWNNRFQGVGSAPVTKVGGVYRVPLRPLARPEVFTFHWWYGSFYPRITVPGDVIGVCNLAEARLVGPNAGRAKMICSVSGDVWPVPTGGKPDGTQVSAMAQPRMTWLTPEWQLFGGVSYPKGTTNKPITKAMLRDNPPPL